MTPDYGCSRIMVEVRQQRGEILDLHPECKRDSHGRNIPSILPLWLQNKLGVSAQQAFVDPEQHGAILAVNLVVKCPHNHRTIIEPINRMSMDSL